MARERLVVVGNGMAGLRFLEDLLARAPDRYDIAVVGAEPDAAYNRVLLSSLLAGEIAPADVRMQPRAWYAENGVTLTTGDRATAIDTAARAVQLERGGALSFDKLVLATGSEPVRLLVSGSDLPGVMTFRTLADVDDLRRRAAGGRAAVVIGGGLLGIEAAHGLVRCGLSVTLVHLMDRLMERQLDTDGAGLLAEAIAAKGVRVLLGAQTRAVRGDGRAEALELADGRVIDCDLVVMAVGIRPSTALAAAAGLRIGRGILVDDRMQTSVDGIYAIGECAEHRGTCYGIIEPCYDQARVAACAIAGQPEAGYAGSVPATNLKVSGVPVFSVGDFEAASAEVVLVRDTATPSYRKLVLRDGCLTGAVLVGDTTDAFWYADLIRAGAPIAAFRETLAFGRSFSEAA